MSEFDDHDHDETFATLQAVSHTPPGVYLELSGDNVTVNIYTSQVLPLPNDLKELH